MTKSEMLNKITLPKGDTHVLNTYYTLFISQLGLTEIESNNDYSLTPVQGRNWTLSLEDVAAAMKQMQEQGKLQTAQMLAMLTFVIEKLDKSDPLPQYIISYMCRDAVTRVVLERFNEVIGCTCTNLLDLSYKIGDNVAEANATFNTIRICDPAMGSGHFLITLMNEIIAVKSQLGILADTDDNPLYQYKIVTNGNRLIAQDKKKFNEYAFAPSNPETRRIHEAFLNEKRMCIENCLYGVDVNPISVIICRLRLWHELLIHACRDGQLSFDSTYVENNLRCGDALVSRFPIKENLHAVFKRIGYSVSDYKMLAKDLKKARTSEEKENISKMIALIKDRIRHTLLWDEKNNEDLIKWQRELETLETPNLFDTEERKSARLEEARLMIRKYKQKAAETNNNPVFGNAIEWRYEFPDMLSDTGAFSGFDIVIGNPPDTQKKSAGGSDVYKQMNYKVFKQTGDVSSLFYELGNKILRQGYFLSYIAANSWLRSVSAGKMRQFLMEETNPLLMIEFEESDKIERSLVGKGLIILQKTRNQHRMMSCKICDSFDTKEAMLDDYLTRHAALSFMNIDGQTADATTPFGILSEAEKNIKSKIEQFGLPLRTWDIHMHAGIKTGCDEAFIIDEKTKDSFVRADYKNSDIIKPLLPDESIKRYTPEKSALWLICIPWHFPLLYDKTITRASLRAEERFNQQYPLIYEHLVQYKSKLISRDTTEVGITFEWYALQRLSMSNEWDDFTQQKIVWRQEAPTSDFCFDYGGCAVPESACFIIGQHLKYLLGLLNSKLGQYMLKDSPRMNNGDIQISTLALEALHVPMPNVKIEADLISLVNKRTSDLHPDEWEETDRKIDRIAYDVYNLSKGEIEFIEKEMNHI